MFREQGEKKLTNRRPNEQLQSVTTPEIRRKTARKEKPFGPNILTSDIRQLTSPESGFPRIYSSSTVSA